jgi:hypothetical protein
MEGGLAAALAMQDERYRAEALTAFLELISDNSALVSTIRQSICRALLSTVEQRREIILSFFANETLWAPPVFTQEQLGVIAQHIIEICTVWQWL